MIFAHTAVAITATSREIPDRTLRPPSVHRWSDGTVTDFRQLDCMEAGRIVLARRFDHRAAGHDE